MQPSAEIARVNILVKLRLFICARGQPSPENVLTGDRVGGFSCGRLALHFGMRTTDLPGVQIAWLCQGGAGPTVVALWHAMRRES